MNRMELARSVYLAYAKAEKSELDVEWTASLMGGDSDNAHGVKIAIAMYDARQAEIDDMREGLSKAAKKFRFYQIQHRNKHTIEGDAKAATNADMAAYLEGILAKQDSLE